MNALARIKTAAVTAALATSLLACGAAQSSSSQAPATVTATTTTTPVAATVAPYTLVLGDSITALGSDELHQLHPSWIIDGVPYRNVNRLMPLIRYWTETKGRKPTKIVVALGTNWSRTWDGVDYRRVLRRLPNTQIEFVTPLRDLSATSTYATPEFAYELTGKYAYWMRRLAKNHRGVCVADWRRWALAHPEMLKDGVHPVPEAEGTWAQLVSDGMDRCVAEGHR